MILLDWVNVFCFAMPQLNKNDPTSPRKLVEIHNILYSNLFCKFLAQWEELAQEN